MCDQQSLRPACAYTQSDKSLCWSLEYSINTKLLTKHNLEPPSLKGGCRGSSEYTHDKMPHCWTSRVAAHFKNPQPMCSEFASAVSVPPPLASNTFPQVQVSSKSYTMGCPPVRGDNPRALASGLSYVQVEKTWHNYFITPTPV